MFRLLSASAATAAILCLAPLEGAAQGGEGPFISVEPRTGQVVIELDALLQDGTLEGAVHQGLPLRIRVEAELWRDRFFDTEERAEEWGASLLYDPVALRYEVQVGGQRAREFSDLDDARAHLADAFSLELRPSQPGRYYYLAVVELETLSLSDLEELRRWLNGDLAPAVGEGRDVGGALGRGVQRLFVRALGLPTRRVQLRTTAFDYEGDPS